MAKSARKMAKKVASKGRYGDTMLMHVSPSEVAVLDRMNPGSITRNPSTGQPEAWGWLLGLLGKAGAAVQTAGVAAKGAMTAAGSGVMDMLGGGGGGGLAKSVSNAATIQPELASTMGADVSSNILGGNVKAPSVMERMGNMGRDMLKAGGPQNYLSDKMGIPTDAQGLVGMAGEKLGVNPVITEGVQDLMSMPASGVPGQQEDQMERQSLQRVQMNKLLQPASVPTAASRQIDRQGGVQSLVAQRFGAGSPITKYIGSYEDPGLYTAPANGRQENITATIEPGETVFFGGDPNAPDASSRLSANINQPLMGDRGNYSYPDQSKGVHASGTDIFRPNQRKTTGLEKTLGWLGFLGSQLQGKMPSDRFREGQAWSLDRDYRKEFERVELQAHEEGRDLTLQERNVMNAMRDRIGVGRQETYKPGDTRTVASQISDQMGRNYGQPQRYGSFTGWTNFGEPGPTTAASGSDRKIYYDKKGNETEGATAAQWRWSRFNRGTGQLDPPSGPMVPIQAGQGAASMHDMLRDDDQLMSEARALYGAVTGSGWSEEGSTKALPTKLAKRFHRLYWNVTGSRPSGLTSAEDMEEYLKIQALMFEILGDQMGAAYKAGDSTKDKPAVSPFDALFGSGPS